jgi:hypothetical protein
MMKTFLLLILFVPSAHASEILSQTSSGTGIITEEIAYTGYSKNQSASGKKEGGWDWNLGYTYSAIKLGATVSATPAPVVTSSTTDSDHTSSFSGGFGYSDHWSAGVDLNTSSTKEENLSSFGPSVHAGYTFELSHADTKVKSKLKPKELANISSKVPSEANDAQDDEAFVPTLGFTLTAGTTQYTQDFTTAAIVRVGSRRVVRPKAGSQSIQQKEGELSITLSAVEWLDVSLSGKSFIYNQNVATFLASLDDPRAVRTGAASFGSTLSGFSSKEFDLDLTFHLPEDFDILTEYAQSTSATDSSHINTYKLDVTKLWGEHWKTGLGFERDKSSNDAQSLGEFTLAYEF